VHPAPAGGDLDKQVAEAVRSHQPVTNGTAPSFEPWLVAWLIEAGFAKQVDGVLVATPGGIEIGSLIR
jgi:hypothetical protein